MPNRIISPLAHVTAPKAIPPEALSLLAVLEADWRQISATDPVPNFADIDPHRLNDALPHAFIASKTAQGSLRVRVAGQSLHDQLQFDPRGMSVGTFFTDKSAALIRDLLDSILDAPAILGVPLIAQRGFGRRAIRGQLLALPLRDAQGATTKIMGAIVSAPTHRPAPIRFDLAPDMTIRHDALGLGFADRRRRTAGLHLVVDNTARRGAAVRSPEASDLARGV